MASEDGMLAELVIKYDSKKISGILVRNLWEKVRHIVDKDLDELVVL